MTVDELLDLMIDRYAEWARFSRWAMPEEDTGRFWTVAYLAQQIHPELDSSTKARVWLDARVEERLSAMRHNDNGEE